MFLRQNVSNPVAGKIQRGATNAKKVFTHTNTCYVLRPDGDDVAIDNQLLLLLINFNGSLIASVDGIVGQEVLLQGRKSTNTEHC